MIIVIPKQIEVGEPTVSNFSYWNFFCSASFRGLRKLPGRAQLGERELGHVCFGIFFALAQTVCVENLKVLGWLMMLSFSTHEQKQHFFGQVSRWDRATKLLWGFEVWTKLLSSWGSQFNHWWFTGCRYQKYAALLWTEKCRSKIQKILKSGSTVGAARCPIDSIDQPHQFMPPNFSNHIPWRIHGAGILMLTSLGYIDGIHGTPYMAAPWITGVPRPSMENASLFYGFGDDSKAKKHPKWWIYPWKMMMTIVMIEHCHRMP